MSTKLARFALPIVILVCSMSLGAQVERATIAGTVRDASGAVVPNASVTVTNIGTKIDYKTTTGGSGEYVAPNLIPGDYAVSVSAGGFATALRSGITLHINQRLAIDVDLQVGATTTQVEVTAPAPLVQRESAAITTLIQRRDIAELPTNGRSVFQLAYLVAGVTKGIPSLNANGVGTPDNARAAQGLSVNAQIQSTNSYILDGVYNNQINQGLMAIIAPLEAVQEFQMETSNFLPEVGRGGGVMNVTLKSGTNGFHGSLFDYMRNSALDARNLFDAQPTPSFPRRLPNFVQNQFGGAIGGPIVKNKTFFFFDYQGFRQRLGLSSRSVVPTAAARAGDFAGTLRPIFDPDTWDPVTLTRQPFPNQQIDPSRFSPAAVNILQYIPLPNDPTELDNGAGYFWSTASVRRDQYNYDIKINHQFSERDSLAARWSMSESHVLLPGAYADLPAYAPAVGRGVQGLTGNVSNPARSLGLQWIHTFSPRLINEARAAYVRVGSNATPLGSGKKWADELGIPNAAVTDNNTGFPTMTISGLSTIGSGSYFPLIEFENVFQFLDNMTYVTGSHTFKGGADFKKVQRQFTQILAAPAGRFWYDTRFTADPANAGTTGNPVASFMLGIPYQASLYRNAGLAGLRTTELSAYWQDVWKASSKLTVNYGVRYDLYTPQTEVYDRQSSFDLETGRLLVAPAPDATNPNMRNRALQRTNKLNFAPRLGLAYALTPKTAIRAAYGIFFYPGAHAGSQQTQNPPFIGGVNVFNTAVPQDIVRTMDDGFPVTDPFTPIDEFTWVNHWNPDNKTSNSMQYSLNIQRQLSTNMVLEVGYVGYKITHAEFGWITNVPVLGNSPVLERQQYGTLVGRQFNTWDMENKGKLNYNGLQVTLRKNFSSGVSFLTNYTWGKALGVLYGNFGTVGVQDWNDHDRDYGPLETDIRHRWVTSVIYELPFGRGKALGKGASGVANAFIGGWQVGGITNIQSGGPFLIYGGAGYPDRVCDGNLPRGQRTLEKWFDPSCFVVPASVPDPVAGGVYVPYGNTGHGVLTGPGIVNFDLSLMKNFTISEGKRLEFRSEFFNAFNTPHYGTPNNTVLSGATGQITSTVGTARQIQLVLRFVF